MHNTEIERQYFDCPKMSSKVLIIRKMLIQKSNRGGLNPPVYKIPSEIDCKSKDKCGIRKDSEMITYDWSECVHSELRKHQ